MKYYISKNNPYYEQLINSTSLMEKKFLICVRIENIPAQLNKITKEYNELLAINPDLSYANEYFERVGLAQAKLWEIKNRFIKLNKAKIIKVLTMEE